MLLTKLHIPEAGNNLVHRPALFEKFNQGLERKLILVSASAGFGKTTAISDWIKKEKIQTAWYSIDDKDNDFAVFLSYIIYSLQTLNKDFGESALKLLQSPTLPNSESIINLLINEIIELKINLLLVFDDFHLINNQEIIKAVSYFLEYIPGNIHLALLSRSDPNLPIAKLRSQNQLVELRSSDLSFATNDIAVLFNKTLKLKLKMDDIKSLEKKTEGWIAGLQLTAMSIQGSDDASSFINNLAGNNRYIMDYLLEEVIRVQSDEINEFLLKTSLFEQFSASLCNSVLEKEDSQVILEKLEHNNMFVFPLDSERRWYRYHHLFSDLLKQRLTFNNNSLIKELHKRACIWFEENNMYTLAIDHALKIEDYEKVTKLLGKVVDSMWESGQHAAILKYGELLPIDLIKTNPEFCLYYAWILISSGQIKKAKPFLESAEKATINSIQSEKARPARLSYYKKLLGKISVAFAYLNSHQEHSEEVFEYCKTAMENLSDDDPFWFSWAWFSYGISYFAKGDLEKSYEAFNNAFENSKKTGNIYLISTIVMRMAENEQQLGNYRNAYRKCKELLKLINEKGYSQITKTDWTYASLYFIMGITEYIWMDTEKGIENLKIAYKLSRNSKDVYQKVFILMAYSAILNELGYAESENRRLELEEFVNKYELPPFLTGFYIGMKIYFFIARNQFEEAHLYLHEQGIKLGNEITHINESAYSGYARLLIAENKLIEAEPLISKIYDVVSKGKKIERMIDLKILLATLSARKGDKSQAISYLFEAMELGYKDNLLSYFVFNSTDNIDLYKELFKIHATKKTNIPQKFIDDLKIAMEKKNQTKKIQVTDLSSRELDTLKLVAENLTYQEIADKLFISLNTVKTHLKNIYLKLEVDSRTKAIAKAKERKLI